MSIPPTPTTWPKLGEVLSSWNLDMVDESLSVFAQEISKREREELVAYLKLLVSGNYRSDEYAQLYRALNSDLLIKLRGNKSESWRTYFRGVLSAIDLKGT